MQDRPDARELLEAVRVFLEREVVPALDGTRQFHARVAANVLAIVGREIANGEEGLRDEWRRLLALLEIASVEAPEGGTALIVAVRSLNETLVGRIRDGAAEDELWRTRLLTHLRATTMDRLAVANPQYMVPRSPE